MVSTMNITEKNEGATVILLIEGRLDTTTAPALEAKIKGMEGSLENLCFSFYGKISNLMSPGIIDCF